MTDRELLELAAKAAGIKLFPIQISSVTTKGDDIFIGYMTKPEQWERGWFNPLTDDGDALRLAVKLGIGAQSYAALGYSHAGAESVMRSVVIKEPHNDDPCASTRRAIVRAAATIGASK